MRAGEKWRNFIDETGNRYGLLTVKGAVHRGNSVWWLCECDCGNECLRRGVALRRGYVRSCGCLRDMTADERMELGIFPNQGVHMGG